MKIVKFRAWDKKNKVMLYAIETDTYCLTFTFYHDGKWELIRSDLNSSFDTVILRSEDGVLQQFSGLLDSQKKEMYQGDIMEVEYETDLGVVKLIGQMVWNPSMAQFGTIVSTELMSIPSHVISRRMPRVIGDIYQNPELLK